jgi:exonuclease III
LYKIHHRLIDIFNNNLPFGGVSIMFVGDMLQLKPVKAGFIFEVPSNDMNALYYNESSLWHNFEAITLKHNHRQGEGSEFLETLNRMRTGDQNEDDIKLLKTRCIKKLNKKFPHDAVNLFFTNLEVKDHNIKKLNQLKTKLYKIKYMGDYPSTYKPQISKYGTVDDTNLCEVLQIKVGARVMVVMNVNTTDSLVNGMIGVVLDIITDDTNGKVKCIIVKFDSEKVGADQRKKHSHIADKYKEDNGTPIFRQKVRYHLTGAGKKVHAITGTCFQFPLKLAFAITGHKMQGQTIKTGSKLVVNWSKMLPPGLAYVMCSRTESINDLFIGGQFDPKKIKANPKALKEAKRLDEISLANRPQTISPLNQLLRFGFVNIRSLNANFEFLEDDELMKELDIIFVTETWMDSKIQKTYQIDGYNSAFANGKTARGKGVGVFFKKDPSIEICEEELYQFIKLKNEHVTIFCLYISKGCHFSQVVQSLQDFRFFDKEENTCLIGDLNFDASKTNDLTRYLSRLQFKQMVARATHFGGHILDQVYVPETRSDQFDTKHHYCYYSDHDGILVSLKNDVITGDYW